MELPVANLVYSASGACVRTVIIDGRIVMDDQQFTTINEADFLRRAATHTGAIYLRLGVEAHTVWPVT